jgi:hypothetical protein
VLAYQLLHPKRIGVHQHGTRADLRAVFQDHACGGSAFQQNGRHGNRRMRCFHGPSGLAQPRRTEQYRGQFSVNCARSPAEPSYRRSLGCDSLQCFQLGHEERQHAAQEPTVLFGLVVKILL